MPQLKFKEVLTFSSEDPNHPADNLLKSDTYLKWKSASGRSEKQEYVVLKLEKLSCIRSLDIGNENCAFIEVVVSREEGDFKVLLGASSFMSPLESRNGTNTNRVRMFGSDRLNKSIAEQKWDRIKFICTQPFTKNIQYGLTFVKVYSPEEKSSSDNETKLGKFTLLEDDDDVSPSAGSFFAKRKEKESPLTGAAAIRAASKIAAQSPEQTKPLKRPAEESNSNAPDLGFYQLKKKIKESSQDMDRSASPSLKSEAKPEIRNQNEELDAKNSSDNNSTKHRDKKSDKNEKQDVKNSSDNNSAKHRDKKSDKNQKQDVKNSSDNNSAKHRDKKSDSSSNSNSSKTPKKRVTRPFNKLMSDVVFVLSGYQNPQRSNLRDSLTDMGAKYKNDWGSDCTHLICAFRNTPKFQSVKGKGKIVTEKWVEDCFKKKIRFPWRRYNLEKNRSDESEDEIWASEICPDSQDDNERKPGKLTDADEMNESEDTDDEIQRAIQKNKQTNDKREKKSPDDSKEKIVKQNNLNGKHVEENKSSPPKSTSDDEYDADTDVDEEESKKDTEGLPLPPLKNIFKEKVFFIYGSLDESKKKSLIRYVTAFQGKVATFMSEEVTYVITDDSWDENFDNALEDNPNLQFVKCQWIWKCCNSEKMVPPQPFLIVPKEES